MTSRKAAPNHESRAEVVGCRSAFFPRRLFAQWVLSRILTPWGRLCLTDLRDESLKPSRNNEYPARKITNVFYLLHFEKIRCASAAGRENRLCFLSVASHTDCRMSRMGILNPHDSTQVRFDTSKLYCLQHSSPTLLYNTVFQDFSTTLFPTPF